jgi:hypothetical protein
MTEAVFDFPSINRRMNRKPEPACALCKPAPMVVPPELAAELDWTHELTELWDLPAYRTYLESVDASGHIVRVWA